LSVMPFCIRMRNADTSIVCFRSETAVSGRERDDRHRPARSGECVQERRSGLDCSCGSGRKLMIFIAVSAFLGSGLAREMLSGTQESQALCFSIADRYS